MPRFAANLSMMFTERPFLDRFAAAKEAGFDAVEFLFPYAHSREEVRAALDDIGFTGWATAEVGGGGLERLTKVRKQMENVFGLS